MNESVLQALDQQIQAEKTRMARGDALERLFKNKDFQLLVLDGYLRDEAVRLVNLRGDPAMFRPETQASILRDIDAIASFSNYLRLVRMGADQAAKALDMIEEERQLLVAGGEV